MIHAGARFCSNSLDPADDYFMPIQPFGRPGGPSPAHSGALRMAESGKDSSDKSRGHGAPQGCPGASPQAEAPGSGGL